MKLLQRLLSFDRKRSHGIEGLTAGVDEAGRGPLAGPVFAAAVILVRKSRKLSPLNDSKKVPPPIRETLYREILRSGLIGVGMADENEIEKLNIYYATRLAMKRAVLALNRTPDLVLVDGNMKIDLPLPQQTIVEGDAKSASIAAASIIAKVTRDAWMTHLDTLYPHYQFKDHKGYATPEHLRRLEEYGPCPVHRKGFAPVDQLSFPQDLRRESTGIALLDPRLNPCGDDNRGES